MVNTHGLGWESEMRYWEIAEASVRMGERDLNSTDLSGVLVGFEFEIAGKVPKPDRKVAFAEFKQWHDELSMEDWFFQTFGTMESFLLDYPIEPKYGYATAGELHAYQYGKKEVRDRDRQVRVLLSMPRDTNQEKVQFLVRYWTTLQGYYPDEARKRATMVQLDREITLALQDLNNRLIPDAPENPREVIRAVRYDDGAVLPLSELTNITDIQDAFDLPDEVIEQYREAKERDYQDRFEEWLERHYIDVTANDRGVRQMIQTIKTALPYDVTSSMTVRKVGKGDGWLVTTDGSIKPIGVELVSPPLPAPDALSALHTVFNMIKSNDDLMTNDTTGLHVNVSVEHPDKIDLLKLSLLMGEDHLLRDWGREGNQYAQKTLDAFANKLSDNPGSIQQMIGDLNDLILQKPEHHAVIDFGKLQKGYLEFRATGGAGYEARAQDGEKLVKRYVRLIQLASDPLAGREAYLKKLHQWLERERGQPINWTREFGVSEAKAREWLEPARHKGVMFLDPAALQSRLVSLGWEWEDGVVPPMEEVLFFQKICRGVNISGLKNKFDNKFWKMIFRG